MKNRRVVIAWLLLISWALLIFFFSSQVSSDSSTLSSGVMDFINQFLPIPIDLHTVRKLAHFTEFFILGVLSFNTLSCYPNVTLKRVVAVAFFCFVYASLDEFHQSFVPGRAPSLIDVGIDTLGSSIGVFVTRTFITYRKGKNA